MPAPIALAAIAVAVAAAYKASQHKPDAPELVAAEDGVAPDAPATTKESIVKDDEPMVGADVDSAAPASTPEPEDLKGGRGGGEHVGQGGKPAHPPCVKCAAAAQSSGTETAHAVAPASTPTNVKPKPKAPDAKTRAMVLANVTTLGGRTSTRDQARALQAYGPRAGAVW